MRVIARSLLSLGVGLALVETGAATETPPAAEAINILESAYPQTRALGIPYWGSVSLRDRLPDFEGEYWISADHLINHKDFHSIEILVDHRANILGGRGLFKGTAKEWQGDRGYQARKRVVSPLTNPEAPLPRSLPLAIHQPDFGDLVFTFDHHGVSWRRVQLNPNSGQGSADQPVTAPESKPESNEKPNPESEGRSE